MSVSKPHPTVGVVPPFVPAAETERLMEQDCPATVMANWAVPLVEGVPESAKVTEPVPVLMGPAVKVAVSPVTPVDATACPAASTPPFPPE